MEKLVSILLMSSLITTATFAGSLKTFRGIVSDENDEFDETREAIVVNSHVSNLDKLVLLTRDDEDLHGKLRNSYRSIPKIPAITVPYSTISTSNLCGSSPEFNDQDAAEVQIPWQAGIYTPDDDGQFLCSGVLVSSKYVVTAAICLVSLEYDVNPSLIQVRLGPLMNNSNGIPRHHKTGVSQIQLWPDTNGADSIDSRSNAKIALLQLKDEIDFSSFPSIKPICLKSTELKRKNMIRHKKDFEIFKFSPSKSKSYARKKYRLMSKSLFDQRNDDTECYVSGWGINSSPSAAFMGRHQQKRDLSSFSTLTIPIVSERKYYVYHPGADSSDKINSSLSSSGETTENDLSSSSESSTESQQNLSSHTLNPQMLNIPYNLDPIQDYVDSLQKHVKTAEIGNSYSYDRPQLTSSSRTRKKQLKPLIKPVFDTIESDELLVDKEDEADGWMNTATPRSTVATKDGATLKWAPVTLHKINSSSKIAKIQHVNPSLGTEYLEHLNSKTPNSLCMVDLGSPVICSRRNNAKNTNQKFLSGIVTWKMPCLDEADEDVKQSLRFLKTNYEMVQVTPIEQFLGFIQEHVAVVVAEGDRDARNSIEEPLRKSQRKAKFLWV